MSATLVDDTPLPLPRSAPRVRLEFLDGVRGLAALYVVCYHILALYHDALSIRVQAFLSPLWFGHYAVDVFIVVSGFSLMLPVVRTGGILKGGTFRFYQKRARRISPPYYIALALSLAVALSLHLSGFSSVTRLGVVSHLLLLQDVWFSTWRQINPPLWSVAVEWRIYFIFPLLVWMAGRFGMLAAAAIMFAVSLLLVFAFLRLPPLSHLDSQLNGISPQFLGLFVLGASGASVSLLPAMALRRAKLALAAGTAFLLVAVVVFSQRWSLGDPRALPRLDYLVGVWAMALLVYLSVQDGALRHWFASRELVKIGAFAYSLYLTHAVVLEVFYELVLRQLHGGPRPMMLLNFFVGIPLCVAAAYLFYLGFEKPFMTGFEKGSARPEPSANVTKS